MKLTWRSLALLFSSLVLAPLAAQAQNPDCEEPNVLIVFDVSGSMGKANKTPPSKYDQAVQAIHQVTQNTQSDIRFGLMVFPQPGPAPVYCGADQTPAVNVPLGLNHWDPIFKFISPFLYNSTTPNPQFFGGPRGDFDTPMVQALRTAGDLTELLDPDRRNYVLFISDGAQDCSHGGDYDLEKDANTALPYTDPNYFYPDEYAENRQDAITAVDDMWYDNIDTFVVGFGALADATTLNQLAVYGGTADWDCTSNCYFQANDSSQLTAALQAIGQIVQAETCDGMDNDCDGDTDEGTDVLCDTACGSGYKVCTDGAYAECNAPQPQTEVCDGVDNDCDDDIDEGCGCVGGETRDCGSDVGDCVHGSQTCTAGAWGPCDVVQGPTPEVCEGSHDEDCDNFTDEGCGCTNGMTRRCGTEVGECVAGNQTCQNGQWGACVGEVPPATTDECDGKDNDCDGDTDEYCDCADGDVQACGSSLGICVPGHQTCQDGNWTVCLDAEGPQGEVCDNVDNDCDGEVDNDASCGSTLSCRCGSCVGPCGTNDTCPSGAECIQGFCILEDSCPPGQVCDGTYCVDPDDNGGDDGSGDDGNTENGGGDTDGRGKKFVQGPDGGCKCNASTPFDVGAMSALLAGLKLLGRRRRR